MSQQWRRQDFVTGGVRYGSIGCLEYEVPKSRLYCLCINVALCSTALQCICRVIRRSSITMKAHTYYIIFGRPRIGGKLPPSPLATPLCHNVVSPSRDYLTQMTQFCRITLVYCSQYKILATMWKNVMSEGSRKRFGSKDSSHCFSFHLLSFVHFCEYRLSAGKESVAKIIISNTINLFLKLQSAFW